jgi:hypothetical protein
MQIRRVCHDTLPWLISFSLDLVHYLFILALVFTGCASPADRYHQNIAHEYLSPAIRKLPRSDVEEITRVVSAVTMQDIVGISKGKNEAVPGEVNVTTAYPTGGATLYSLVKRNGQWHIRWSGEISDSLVGLVYDDP